MIVEVSADKPIAAATVQSIVTTVEAVLVRHKNRLTRAEVHLKNVGDAGPAMPIECKIEARPKGRDPVVASHKAETMEDSVAAAAEKMDNLLESLFGKLDSAKGGPSASGLPT